MMKVYFGTTSRGSKTYWTFVSDTDECNFLYDSKMLLNKCKREYAEAHGVSVDSIEFINMD